MAHRIFASTLILLAAFFLTVPANAQQPTKPFTQAQVQAMVRDGLGDETGAKALAQRGIDFAPTEDFIQSLKTAGASEAFIAALRRSMPPAFGAAGNVAPTLRSAPAVRTPPRQTGHPGVSYGKRGELRRSAGM